MREKTTTYLPLKKLWHLLIKIFSENKIIDYVEHLIAKHILQNKLMQNH